MRSYITATVPSSGHLANNPGPRARASYSAPVVPIASRLGEWSRLPRTDNHIARGYANKQAQRRRSLPTHSPRRGQGGSRPLQHRSEISLVVSSTNSIVCFRPITNGVVRAAFLSLARNSDESERSEGIETESIGCPPSLGLPCQSGDALCRAKE
jgi:hypothetical protein